jgi:hypothetical protein
LALWLHFVPRSNEMARDLPCYERDVGTPRAVSNGVPMTEIFELLVKKYRVFYEVSPFHVLVEEAHGSPTATRHIIQAGFDVDVQGISNKDELELPPPGDYALAEARLKKIADTVAQHASDCSIEVIPFDSSVFSEAGANSRSEALIRIRISHRRGIDQPVGLPEQHALEELESQLQGVGLGRR